MYIYIHIDCNIIIINGDIPPQNDSRARHSSFPYMEI